MITRLGVRKAGGVDVRQNRDASLSGAPLVLSVDGGGTATEAWVVDVSGEPVIKLLVGPLSVKSTSAEEVDRVLTDLDDALEAAYLSYDDFALTVWGLSGLDTAQTHAVYEKLLDDAGVPRARRLVVNDAVLPLFAAGCETGVVLVAGTGSIALGIDGAGTVRRAGGWGYAASDGGSGYWIGRAALAYTLRCADGIERDDGLAVAVARAYGAPSPEALKRIAADGLDPVSIAAGARTVLEHEGSAAAREIMRAAAGLLADLVTACAPGKAEAPSTCDRAPVPVIFSGGLFTSVTFESFVREAVLTRWRERGCAGTADMQRVGQPPVWGGAVLARHVLAGRRPFDRWLAGEVSVGWVEGEARR